MGDKQCEIMMRFEDVFGCGSPMWEMGEQELVFIHVCVGMFKKKRGGGGLKVGPDVFVD